jgi:adenosine kinase
VVKHAVIQRSTPGGERADLLPFLERNASALGMLQEPATSYAIRRNVALKAAVVAADEQEHGIRAFLNFGHTLGHGIEAADYALLHGEAVALGMRAAARIGRSVGTCDSGWVARIDDALDRFDLPRAALVEPSRVLEKVRSDKKRAAGRLRWVLPLGGGGVTIRDDVPEACCRRCTSSSYRARALAEGASRRWTPCYPRAAASSRDSVVAKPPFLRGEPFDASRSAAGWSERRDQRFAGVRLHHVVPGSFKDHILPDKVHVLSVSFLFDSLQRLRGGIAGNIAYNLALLGERPAVVGAGGGDFAPYRVAFDELGIDTELVTDAPDLPYRLVVHVDRPRREPNRRFLPWRFSRCGGYLDLGDCLSVSLRRGRGDDAGGDGSACREIADVGCKLVYDPSQQLVAATPDDLLAGIERAWAFMGSDYEFAMLERKTGLSIDAVADRVPFVVVTYGGEGSTILTGGERITIPIVAPEPLVDPTGGGDAYRAGLLKGLLLGLHPKVAGGWRRWRRRSPSSATVHRSTPTTRVSLSNASSTVSPTSRGR